MTLLGKPPGQLFAEMEGAQSEFHVGDVKYHTGQAATLEFPRKVDPTHTHIRAPPGVLLYRDMLKVYSLGGAEVVMVGMW